MIINNDIIQFNSGVSIASLDSGVYNLCVSPNGPYLEVKSKFDSKNLYGFSNDIISFVVNHYNNSAGNFGCIFSGISGMGKTQTIKNLCNMLNLPILTVNSAISGPLISSVIDQINSPCIVLFDEFEKVYCDTSESNTLLSLFDGFTTKHRVVFIVSMNERSQLSQYFFGRPGRFLYNFQFSSLEVDDALNFIKSSYNGITDESRFKNYLYNIDNLSYDICDKIINTCKIHGFETFIKMCDHFNVNQSKYRMNVKVDGKGGNYYKYYSGVFYYTTISVGDIELEVRDLFGNNYEETLKVGSEISLSYKDVRKIYFDRLIERTDFDQEDEKEYYDSQMKLIPENADYTVTLSKDKQMYIFQSVGY